MAFSFRLLNFHRTDSNENFNIVFASPFYTITLKSISTILNNIFRRTNMSLKYDIDLNKMMHKRQRKNVKKCITIDSVEGEQLGSLMPLGRTFLHFLRTHVKT